MNYNYSEYLLSRLNRIIANNVEFEGYSFEIADEQMFADLKTPDPHKFYIVIKYLSAQKVYNTTTQPVQIQVVSEQDGFSKCKLLLDTFVNAYNWQMEKDGSTYIKQQYNTPVVLSNFQSIGYGMRSVLYIAGTILVMEDVLDINNFKVSVDNITENIEPINFSFSYGMSGNSQQLATDYAVSTVKSTANISYSMVVPFTDTYFIKKIINIMNGNDSGNTTFTLSFYVGQTNIEVVKDVKLISATISDAPNQITGLQLGFMK